MKKVRGKRNKKDTAVKIQSVSNIDFILRTSFATYRIPRSHFVTFQKAKQHALQNVVGFMSHTYQFDKNGSYILSFYWYELDDVFDEYQFERFKVTDEG